METRDAFGESAAFLDFQARLSEVAPVPRPVLLIGERGTGKELASERLHYLSPRWEQPLIKLNCAALSPTLLEAELFGYEAGAFTGATGRRLGRFEAADGGTLLLDEVGLLSRPTQEKLLRVVEYGAFERVGGVDPVEVDVRLIGATNADLPAMAARGEFMPDLLDRLSFEVLTLPPLRERTEDILPLTHRFAAAMLAELGRSEAFALTEAAEEQLLRFDWPGNIRQLKNVVERSVYRWSGEEPLETFEIEAFSRTQTESVPVGDGGDDIQAGDTGAGSRVSSLTIQPLDEALDEVRIHSVREALRRSRFHQGKAAQYLGLTYHQFRSLYRRLKPRLQVESEDCKKN
jgi:psp operon transcriptional activator